MSDRMVRGIALALVVAVTVFVIAYVILLPGYGGGDTLNDTNPREEGLLVAAAYLGVLLGAFVVWRQPRNPIGFLLMLEFGFVVYSPTVVTVDWLTSALGPNPVVTLLAWTGNWTWLLAFAGIIFTALLFPDGTYVSPRWSWLGRVAVVVLSAQMLIMMLAPGPLEAAPTIDNPFGVEALMGADDLVGRLMFLIFAVALAGAVSLVVRFVRSSGVERAQLKWIAVGFVVGLTLGITSSMLPFSRLFNGLSSLIPTMTIAAAILKYRLFDIDVVISRSLVFAVLGVFISGVYVGVVVGVGSLLGGGDDPSLLLSIVATGVVAVLFEPVRVWAQGWANRVVFGRRATPYQVLAGLTARLAETASDEDLLGRLAASLGEGTGAEAVVWLRIGEYYRPAASSSGVLPEGSAEEADFWVEVVYEDQTLGLLTLSAARGQQISAADERLVSDVAGNVGLMLRNVRLNTELAERAAELGQARRELVSVQDEERRRLERDLHDGAQQHVVAAAMQLNMARMIAQREGDHDVAAQLEGLADLDQQAVEQLRTIVRGIYPPLLESEGLGAAISGAASSFPLSVGLRAEELGRYGEETEASAYFCMTEVLRDAARRSVSAVQIDVVSEDGWLEIVVVVDAAGSADAGMLQVLTDRIEAAGGELQVTADGLRMRFPAAERKEARV